MNLVRNAIIIILMCYTIDNIFSSTDSLDHEIVQIEQLCENSTERWNGCHQNTLEGWQIHNNRLEKWYQFMNEKNLRLNYLSYLRHKPRLKQIVAYDTMIYLKYAQILSSRACQLRKSMSPYEKFQRLLAWVMVHQMNPIRSGTIRPYFTQILALHEMVRRKKEEFNTLCLRKSKSLNIIPIDSH